MPTPEDRPGKGDKDEDKREGSSNEQDVKVHDEDPAEDLPEASIEDAFEPPGGDTADAADEALGSDDDAPTVSEPKPSTNEADGNADKDKGDGDKQENEGTASRSVPIFLSGILKCTCPKTACLKLYCECLNLGKFCNDGCVCKDCKNKEEFAGVGGERTMAIREILERRRMGNKNSDKIEGNFDEETIKAAVPGCMCIKDHCLKKYCFCYQSGIKCSSDNCICKGCSNIDPEAKSATPSKSKASTAATTKSATTPKLAKKTATQATAGKTTVKATSIKTLAADYVENSGKLGDEYLKKRCLPSTDALKFAQEFRAQRCLPGTNIPAVPIIPPLQVDDGDKKPAAVIDMEKKARKAVAKKTTSRTPPRRPVAIPFSLEEFPELEIDESEDYSKYATSFKRPLFKEPSRALEIAYSQRQEMRSLRQAARKKKEEIHGEYEALRERLMKKKLEMSLANDEVKKYTNKTGAWTKKIFDLELEEPCTWNENCKKLEEYVNKNGKLPPNYKKTESEEEKSLSLWVDRIRLQVKEEEKKRADAAKATEATQEGEQKEEDKGETEAEAEDEDEDENNNKLQPQQGQSQQQPKKRKQYKKRVRKSPLDYPHRLERLEKLGLTWRDQHENKWESMFEKLVQYKEEHGTTKFPSEDQCAASGDQELIALQKWVKSQVLNFRYGAKKKNPEMIKRFLDIGFSFEKWYAKPGKVKMMKGEEVAKFDEVAQTLLEKAGKAPKKRKRSEQEETDDAASKISRSHQGEEVENEGDDGEGNERLMV